MAVFIRKFKEGGGATSSEQTPPTNNQTDNEVQVPKFRIGNHEVNTSDYADALANNFQHFYDTYEGTWTNREKQEIIREHKLFLQNLQAGNITGMNEDGTFEVLDPGYSGLDFSEGGVGKRYSFYAKQVAGAARPNYVKKEAKKKNTFTNTSILRDFYDSFFGGSEKPDYRSFYDLDQVVEGPDGKKVRGVKNRVNAILDLLNENYMSKYDDADESLGGITGATERVDRLRRALADGTLNNEDYAAAAALGLNLRGLLSTDANISFDENGNFSTSTESAPKTAGEQLREMLGGTSETEEQLLNRIKGWDVNTNSSYRTKPMTNWSATDYLQRRMNARNENAEYLQRYYSTEFYPKFFQNLKVITPEYLSTHQNEVIGTWQGDQKLDDYVSLNLTLAIRNKLYNQSSLLPTEISNELNQIVGTNYWTVPGSFDEKTGTISLFDVNTGDYKRVSINNPNLKISIQGHTYTLMQDYLTSKGVKLAKYGAKLQLGGTLNGMVQSGVQEDKVAALSSLFAKPAETTTTPETTVQTQAATEPDIKAKQAEYLAQQGLNAADIRELTSAGLDLASLGAAYIPGYGTVASALTGLTSTGLHAYNLATDADGLTLGDIGETVGNVGLDLVGLIPGFGAGAKSGKILKTITKFAPILIGAFGVAQLPEAAASLKKLTTQGVSSLTVQDYRNLTNGIMAITGAIQYHGIAKPKAEAMSTANGRTVRQYGDMEVKIDGAKDNIKIESSELPEFKRKLESAGGNADAANKVLRESPSIRSEVKRRLGASATEEEIKAALDKITISKTPTATVAGKEVPIGSKSRGLEIKDEVVEGASTLGNSLDERIFKWQQEKAEQLSDLKNPLKGFWKRRYGVVDTPEAPRAEAPVRESEARATETPKETPKAEPSTTGEKPTASEEKPVTESKKKYDVSEEFKSETVKQRAERILKEYESILTSAERNRIKGLARSKSKTSKALLEVESRLRSRKEGVSGAAKATEEASAKIGTSKKGSKLDLLISYKKQGGIVKAAPGNKFDTGVKRKGNSSWTKDVFSGYKNHILDRLSKEGDDYFLWLNEMQSRHSKIYNAAGGENGNWQKIAYRDPSNQVAQYQQDYRGGMDNSNVYNRYGTIKLPEGYNYNFNTTGIAPHQSERYDISGPRRTSGDWGSKDYLIDNLYSSITDDRRLLGRKGDWDENSEEFLNFKKELNDRGFDIYLDSENDNYYKLKKLPSRDPESIQQTEGTPQEEIPGNDNGDIDDGNDMDWDKAGYGVGDSGEGTKSKLDWYKYLPAALAWGRMMGDINSTNRRTKEYIDSLQAPLQQAYRFDRLVHGDYGTMKSYENAGAKVRALMNRAQTSNATLATLRQLEGISKANEYTLKGQLADNEMMHKTWEASAAEEKGNRERATQVANTNRTLMASLARDKAGIRAAAQAANQNSLDAWLMNYVEKPIQEEVNRRRAYQDYYDYISMGPMEYDFSTDAKILAWKDEYNSIKDSTKPEDIQRRKDIIREMDTYKKQKAASYRIGQLRKFRQLNPYIIQRVPFDYNSNNIDPGRMSYDVELDKKGGSTDSYPAAVIRAKSRDNDRLIKQILEIIRNHKDLAKGVRMTDYSKYIVK